MAVNLLREPLVSDQKIKYINKNLDNLSIDDAFNILGLDIENTYPLIEYCFETFKQIEGVINEDNSDIRSYRSR